MGRKIIINADDFGLCKGVNIAVVKAYTEGVLTSATIMTNTLDSDEAVKLARTMPNLGVGVHLNLTEGPLISKDSRVKCLSDINGEFAISPGKLFFLSILSPRVRKAIELELDAQIRWLIDRNLRPVHIDSHKHIHTIPAIFKIVAGLAEKYEIPAIRWPVEYQKFPGKYWPKPGLKGLLRSGIIRMLAGINKLQNSIYFKTDEFLGIAHTGRINVSFFKAVSSHNKASIVEIMTHPGFAEGLNPAKTRLLEQRRTELNALCSQQTKLYFEKAGIQLVHYGQL